MGPRSDIIWKVENLTFAHGDRPVLEDADFSLVSGCCYGVLGPNGSGKTTLLDLLAGLLRPQDGDIRFQGRSRDDWEPRQFARLVALVPQQFTVRFGFTVRQVVEMGRYPYLGRLQEPGVRDCRVVETVMDELDIAHLADRPVTRLSGGEQQRVAVARALAQEPETLLLDEATSNLDIFHTLSILGAIQRRVREQGLTVVAAMHDLSQAAFFCDRAIYLRQGRIFAQGNMEEMMRPEIIRMVYGVDVSVRADEFSGSLQVSYRLPRAEEVKQGKRMQ